MSYWTYYLFWLLLAYGVGQPWLLGGVIVFLVLRRWIPDPAAVVRAIRRGQMLRTQVSMNAANVTARRDLATIYLDLHRPRWALVLVDEALARDPDSAELLYLRGLALHRAGRHAESLENLVRAVDLSPKLRWGEPYRVAGSALLALGRYEEAIDAYDRLAHVNSSDVGVHTLLARAYAGAGDRKAARAEVYRAIDTFHRIPRSLRRRAFGAWLDAQRLRLILLREPGAIAVALTTVAVIGCGVGYVAPHVRRAFTAPQRTAAGSGTGADVDHDPGLAALFLAFVRCGSQTMGEFEGRYVVDLPPRQGNTVTDGGFDEFVKEQFANFRVGKDRITSGSALVQEICPTRILERRPGKLRAEAVFHEDVNDPGDANLVEMQFEKVDDQYRFGIFELGRSEEPAQAEWLSLRRVESPSR